MSKVSEKEILQSLATELAKNLKTEKDISALSRELVKLTVETALGKEMEEHLGYTQNTHLQVEAPATAETASEHKV